MPDFSTTDSFAAAHTTALVPSLEQADTATLLLVLAELTRAATVLDRWGPLVQGPAPEATSFDDEDAREIRRLVAEALKTRSETAPYAFDNAQLNAKLFQVAAGRLVPAEEQQLLLKEMGLSAEIQVS